MTLTLPDALIADLIDAFDAVGEKEWIAADLLVEMTTEYPKQRNQALGTYAQIDTRRSFKTLVQIESTARIWTPDARKRGYDLPLQTLRACVTPDGLPDYEAARRCFEGELSVAEAWDAKLGRTAEARILASFGRRVTKWMTGWSTARQDKARRALTMLQEVLQDETVHEV